MVSVGLGWFQVTWAGFSWPGSVSGGLVWFQVAWAGFSWLGDVSAGLGWLFLCVGIKTAVVNIDLVCLYKICCDFQWLLMA